MLLILFFLPGFLLAQTGTEDAIYLKNGGILRGEIIERNGSESLKIKTACRNVFVVRMEEVEEIRSEKIPERQYHKEGGYINHTGMDILPGSGTTSVRFQMVNGYQFTPQFSAGIGIGFVLYNDPMNLIPLFIDMKYKFLKANSAPFLFLNGGYGFSVWSDQDVEVETHRGGFMLNPGVGLQFETGSGFGWYFTAGYNMDNTNFEQEQWNGRIMVNDFSYRRLQLGFGLTF